MEIFYFVFLRWNTTTWFSNINLNMFQTAGRVRDNKVVEWELIKNITDINVTQIMFSDFFPELWCLHSQRLYLWRLFTCLRHSSSKNSALISTLTTLSVIVPLHSTCFAICFTLRLLWHELSCVRGWKTEDVRAWGSSCKTAPTRSQRTYCLLIEALPNTGQLRFQPPDPLGIRDGESHTVNVK